MLQKEIVSLAIAIIIFGFVASFPNLNNLSLMLVFGFIIIFVSFIAKKAVAYYYETEIETKIWSFQRYGLYERSYFKTPIPIGVILPFLLSFLSFGYLRLFTLLQTEEKAAVYRVAKRHDFYSFTELTEWHIGIISASGIFASLVLALLAYLFNQPELGKLSIYYAASNIIPLGKLDGTKVLFGSKILWAALAALSIASLIWVSFFIF